MAKSAPDSSDGTKTMSLPDLTEAYQAMEAKIAQGGGAKGVSRQHGHGRLTARERLSHLVDSGTAPMELGTWAAWGMYGEYGGAPGAGVVTAIGQVSGRLSMIIANDATVKAGAFFPMTCKKIIRAQMIAQQARLPLIYLVDSAGVFLPLQEDVFPDTDDFGRIFRNNAVISAQGIPQIAAIMGNCVAGGGYLPVLCDTLLMTEGSGLYLAGPALVKAAIGQEVESEELGGASMHSEISGTVDFHEEDDEKCLTRIQRLMLAYESVEAVSDPPFEVTSPSRPPESIHEIFQSGPGSQFDMVDLLECFVDGDSMDIYRAEYGRSLVCAYARIGGRSCGIVANQRMMTERKMPGGKAGPSSARNMPAVIYDDSADKSARFIMDCNQRKIPLIFVSDTTGFMVGRDSEQGGIIRSGAKMVNAMANCVVPKITLILSSSYGAGNYAMCGRAFDPMLTLAWPDSKCAVMGASQAANTLLQIDLSARKRRGEEVDEAMRAELLEAISASYVEQQDIRYGAARGWLDRIIDPVATRSELAMALQVAAGVDTSAPFSTGVLQT
tara:strand:+ start:675 stop:2339 length:1665 start_codon:yes stop_codon:yes gene_type:complete